MSDDQQPIIVKKIKKAAHGHHGGAWKVAYADFVTAMMAFFLLLWLLNVTTDEQKDGIADYFNPSTASQSSSGSGGILGGASLSSEGARVSEGGVPSVVMTLTPPEQKEGEDTAEADTDEPTDEDLDRELAKREQAAFEQAEDALAQAIQQTPDLADLAKHLLVDMTPEGLRIQLVDQDRRSMFPSGSADLVDHTERLFALIAKAVERMPNKIKITGHTDATPFRSDSGKDNWQLSADRANASRRALLRAGLPTERIAQVGGKAETDPLMPDDPFNASNRRISVVLLRESRAPLPSLE